MSYWGDGYWADGYWPEGYWGGAGSSVIGSLYVERCLEVVKFTFQRKDGTGSDTFHIAQDYWSAGSLYPGSPEILPVLANPVSTVRGIEGPLGTINDISVDIHGKSHFTDYGKTFFDLADTHEFRGANVWVYRYFATQRGSAGHSDAVNLRQALKLKGYTWSDDVLSLECQDFWFDDKEISKRLIPKNFADLQPEYQYAYGAIIFGRGNGGNGVIVDAPVIDSNGGDFGNLQARMFLGHTFPSHALDGVGKVYARNDAKAEGEADWEEIEFGAFAGTPWMGQVTGTGVGSQYARYLSLYGRGLVASPTGKGRMLSTVYASLRTGEGCWAADFNGSNNLYRMDDRAYSPGDQSFTISCWVKFDALGQMGIIGKGNLSDGTAEWGLSLRSAGNPTLRFWLSPDGYGIQSVVDWSANCATGVWYHVFAWHDMTNRQIAISVNNGTPVTASTTLTSGTAQSAGTEADGRAFIQLASSAAATDDAYNGRMCFISLGAGAEKVRYALDYVGASRKFYMKSQFSPAADGTSVYHIINSPNRVMLDGEEDKAGPLQLGYIGGLSDLLDGQIAMFGFWTGGVVSPAYRTSIYNDDRGKAYEDLTEDEKFNLASWHDLKDFYGERVDSHGSRHLSDAGFVGSVVGRVNRPFAPERGEVRLRVSRAVLKPEEDSWSPEMMVRDLPIDLQKVRGHTNLNYPVAIPVDPPLLLPANSNFFIALEATNIRDHEYSYMADYESVSGQVHYAKLNEEQGAGWARQQNVRLRMALHVVSEKGGFVSTTGAAPHYSHFTVESYPGFGLPSIPFPPPSSGAAYKFAVRGLKDDAGGTYTGMGGSVIRNPADVIRFLLMNPNFGLGLNASRVDIPSLNAVRAAFGGYDLSFAIDRQTFAIDLIQKVCVQTDSVFYKTRLGKLALHRQEWHAGVFQDRMDEIRHRDQMTLLQVEDVPDEAVYNDFVVNYGVDPLNVPKTADFIYRAGSQNFSSTVYLNDAESVDNDTPRIGKMARSKALYGPLEFRIDFDLFAADSQAPKAIMNRIADRRHIKVKRVTARVPLKDFYMRDLFDTVVFRHAELPCEGGASRRLLVHEEGNEGTWVDYGVPTPWFKQGSAEGAIVNLVEYDQWVDVTIETMNPF